MCGLFGFIGAKPNWQRLQEIAILSQTRGPHAFGFAWVNGKVNVYKAPGLIGDNLDKLAVASQSPIIIGASRLSTSGNWLDNRNNQPLSIGSAALVHNGNVYNADELFSKYSYRPQTNCDSEALLAGLITVGVGPVLEDIDGSSPMAALFLNRAEVLAIRWGKVPHPLYLSRRPEGIYFCSRKMTTAELLPENEVIRFDTTGHRKKVTG